ncbi:DUF4326 domain-containing protein [Roseomonas elaeocarpi]|uniref:DUF4326 domain-containing protein n=1 Tax=Roseomonas elaeocarpi TaxID=907779 RepID=A0ABV6JT05_9PROT
MTAKSTAAAAERSASLVREPVRIQLSRKKGWRMPPNTVKVSRGTAWGNPHRVGISLCDNGDGRLRYMDAADAVAAYRRDLPFWQEHRMQPPLSSLRGKNLACWCKEGPCHADALLDLANREAPDA